MKRTFDVLVAAAALVVLSPVLLLISLLVKLSSPGPVLFRQERVGWHFRTFRICKFRTMVVDAPRRGKPITVGDDPRITRIGKILRKTKMDELPQLINVLLGDMSLVGPRPEVPTYVELYRRDYETVLRVRPGVTDLASLEYRDEAAVLARAADPEHEYRTRVLPEKLRLAKEYVEHGSFLFDLRIIARTAWILLSDRLPRRRKAAGEPCKPAGQQHLEP
jgi:lipopolysaccharide/colanic/teichoic acid biosynthesis glycosyltransferase